MVTNCNHQSSKAVGYRGILVYTEGNITLEVNVRCIATAAIYSNRFNRLYVAVVDNKITPPWYAKAACEKPRRTGTMWVVRYGDVLLQTSAQSH